MFEVMPSRVLPRAPVLALALFGAAAEVAEAQGDMLVLTHGNDTISVERVRRVPGRLDGELLVRMLKQRVTYAAMLTPEGDVVRLENEYRRGDQDPTEPPVQAATLRFAGDSVYAEIRDPNAAPRTQRLGSKPGALPYINPSFALLEPLLLRARALGRDSVAIPMFFVAGGQTLDVTVQRRGSDSVVVTFGPGQVSRLRVDAEARILGGVVPSQGLVVKRVPAMGAAFFMAPPDYGAPVGAPYRAIDVRIPTAMGHELAGTLTVPNGRGPFPAVVTITGSGAQDRDEEIPIVKGYRPFRQLADTLARVGIAVLRMDDRGFGGSGGDAASATSEDLAADIEAGLAWLRRRAEIDPRRVGLIGHSEGGIIGPMIAARDPAVRALVIMAGPSQNGRDILTFQHRYRIEHTATIPPAGRDSVLATAMRAVDSVATINPWLRFFLGYDPRPAAGGVKAPALIVHGAQDQQVTAAQAEELGRLMRAGGNRDVTVQVFEGVNHLFVADRNGNPAGYAALPSGRLRDDVVKTVVEWLRAKL